MDYSILPVPPPWREDKTSGLYYNDLTGETISEHPVQRALQKRSSKDSDGTSGEPETKGEVDIQAPEPSNTISNGRPFLEIDTKVSNATQLVPLDMSTSDKLTAKSLRGKYTDYRCMWKEVGLFGDTNSYGLTLRYFEDGSTEIKFDGVEGMWVATQLEGHYGPIEKIDLFVGAKIKFLDDTFLSIPPGPLPRNGLKKKGSDL